MLINYNLGDDFMKKTTNKLLSAVVALIVILGLPPASLVFAGGETSGMTGTCTWSYDDSGALTIAPTAQGGRMEDYVSRTDADRPTLFVKFHM